jgi:antitoxin component YwqK of YwqJK toxin-antitoxin module
MGLFDFFKPRKSKHSYQWTESEKQAIIAQIEEHNKATEPIRYETFKGDGKPYKYYFDSGIVRAQGYFYQLGYDMSGVIQDEKFQGKNIDFYESGQIKEVTFYRDGVPTGEYYSYNPDGTLQHPLTEDIS